MSRSRPARMFHALRLERNSTTSSHRAEFLASLGWAYLVIGVTLALDGIGTLDTYHSRSLRWVFTVLPEVAWGPLFILTGLAAILCTRARRMSPVVRHKAKAVAFGMAMLLAMCWGMGLLVGLFTGDLLALYGPVVWLLVCRIIYLEAVPDEL